MLTASGYVVARRKAAVASKGTGTLVYLGVDEGDKVKKGQVIARLDDSDVAAARDRARENLHMAEADLNDAKQNLERMRILLKRELVAQAEYDIADARYKRVVATIDSAKFGLREAEVAVDNTRIVAPFDGTVLKKNADVGEIVAPLAGAASSKSGGGDHRRHVVLGSRCRCFRSQHHAGERRTILRNHSGCLSAAALSRLRYENCSHRRPRQGDGAGEDQVPPVRPESFAGDEREDIAFLAAGATSSAAESKAVLTVPAAAVAIAQWRSVVYQIRDERAVEVPVTRDKNSPAC